MSFRRSSSSSRSGSASRHQQPRTYTNHGNLNVLPPSEILPNVSPELVIIVRKLLPRELPLNMHVRDVEYVERGFERLRGTLYMTTFRLVFAPDNELSHDNIIISGNKYIREFDIPLTSIFKIIEAPVDSQPGFTSYLNKHQTGSETRTFSIVTRDFRQISFTKSSDTRSNTIGVKQFQVSTTKMENYIEALKVHTRFQQKEYLYPYRALESYQIDDSSQRSHRSQSFSTMTIGRATDDDIGDFSLSNDERIRSFMISSDWQEELNEADEQQWIVNRHKFNRDSIAHEEGPYVQLANIYDDAAAADFIWHWTHTSAVSYNYRDRGQVQNQKFMLLTVPGIGELTTAGEPAESPMGPPPVYNSSSSSSSSFRFLKFPKKISKTLRSTDKNAPKLICTSDYSATSIETTTPDTGLRRAATDTILISSLHYLYDQPFHRYNLAKFPCNLKRLQTSYEKLIELCVSDIDQDDDKWWTKLSASKWLKYVSKALHGAASLAKLLNFKNIELAGSETDFSCLFSSLIQIFLRRKCRTIKGFCELIVREWIVRGHRFRERFGQTTQDAQGYQAQEAPVFLLFLDCLHQLIVQNPFAFEFTDHFLIEIYHSVCYGYHHTFVFNDIYERLDALARFPKNLLLMSTFDFSLYLYSDIRRLLKNEASVFCQNAPSTIVRTKTRQKPEETKTPSPRIDQSSGVAMRIRPNYQLEAPKSNHFVLDIPLSNDSSTSFNPEQYEYDRLESPQIFTSDLHVDWRVISLELWSQCYCRYDHHYLPSLAEQQLLMDINNLKDDPKKLHNRSKRGVMLDTFHFYGYANSWHPQALDTRV